WGMKEAVARLIGDECASLADHMRHLDQLQRVVKADSALHRWCGLPAYDWSIRFSAEEAAGLTWAAEQALEVAEEQGRECARYPESYEADEAAAWRDLAANARRVLAALGSEVPS
ncbi:MAG: hypothetical protein RLN63_02785, partial [Miltoncostaeaceae bacterium]